jgi:biopolymer transport protein ExbD
MAKEVNQEDVKLDMTSMIDVVFLLIIFFILMPPKEMEGQLQSYLPQDGTPPESNEPPPPPKPKFNITLVAEPKGADEVVTTVNFNNRLVCTLTSLSIGALDQIYAMPTDDKNIRLKAESERDKGMLDPTVSADMRLLIQRMSDAALGAPDGKDTDVIIDAAHNVPFKVILAVLNAGAGAEFKNLKFASPSQEIWKQ